MRKAIFFLAFCYKFAADKRTKVITQLHIINYAIIDEVDVAFQKGLNIITGETGAGKSILMGALGLILGARADTSTLKYSDKKCVVEAVFSLKKNASAIDFLLNNDLDNEGELIVRREIAANGKSRAFVNDTPVTLQQLRELASLLVDLHQQFDTLQLGDSDFQRKVVDALAGNEHLLSSYQSIYKQWLSAKDNLQKLQSKKIEFNKEADFFQYQYDELSEQNFKENELEDLDEELQLLSNSEEIKLALTQASFALQDSEEPVLQAIKQVIAKLDSFQKFHQQIAEIVGRLKSTQIELQDIAQDIEGLNNEFGFDEQRMQVINDRIDMGYKLLKKHGISTTNELIQLKKELATKLEASLNIDEQIESLGKQVNDLLSQAFEIAKKIDASRQQQKQKIQNSVTDKLTQVGMPNARLQVNIFTEKELNFYGINQIEFLFDANKSNRFEPIRKVASGGELSRLMLCIKSLVAENIELPTLIFDEIDSGISGEAAKQVGIIMKALSANIQIIAITHQPQIAAKAHTHFYVYKEEVGDKIKTNIRVLDEVKRMHTIAQMLGGEKPSAAALQSAKEMMEG
ncbi:DNA repair protein RecN [Arachidicoccus sp.]|uniref:DNA repair protein RecN n=1 Tax=Arachidicoccus sp. TaxID=1872624 RepID=UPI003D25D3C9